MQPTSEKHSYLEELSFKKKSLEENWFWFNQNQDRWTAIRVWACGVSWQKRRPTAFSAIWTGKEPTYWGWESPSHYSGLFRPYMEKYMQFWAPQCKNDISKHDWIQGRPTRQLEAAAFALWRELRDQASFSLEKRQLLVSLTAALRHWHRSYWVVTSQAFDSSTWWKAEKQCAWAETRET